MSVSARFPGRTRNSFSLLEMLLVLALAAVLVGAAVAGYSSLIQATAVTAGADVIRDALIEARMDAVAQNTKVEVRIYNLPPQMGATPVYDALQLHWLKADGTTPAVNNVLLLSSWVAIDATAAHSSLIGENTQTLPTDASDSRLNSATRIFHFFPNGSTDLNPATNWFLTVRAASQSDPAHFPANWASVRVDPTTGRVQIYRP